MKIALAIVFTTVIGATAAIADSRVNTLCSVGHVNEIAGVGDVVANPDGFYIRSLKVQISHGDPRIIQTTDANFHLCTANAATPDMDTTMALTLINERRVKYLFAPINCPKSAPGS